MRLSKPGKARLGLSVMTLVVLLFTGSSAKAACGFSPAGKAMPRMPMLSQAGEGEWGGEHWDSIVGQWLVTYTAGGEIFNETIKQWHSDGTETENAWLPPASGNYCSGVWKNLGDHRVKLHHIGWLFDGTGKTTANGYFLFDEEDTVAEDGKTYTGKFTFTPYSINGKKGTAVTGTVEAHRFTAD
jgi:hypothetical protein